MSIKISEFEYMNTNATLTEESKKERTSSPTVKAKHEEPTQTVHHSSQLQNIQHQIAQASVVDMQKVESIKAKIAENKYEVNTKSIAERILSLEKDMFGK